MNLASLTKLPSTWLALAACALIATGCSETSKTTSGAPSARASSTQSPAASTPPKEYSLPSPQDTKLADVVQVANTAISRLPPEQHGKIDEWLGKAVNFPVELTRTAKDSLSDTSGVKCWVKNRELGCGFDAKIAKTAEHFVTSTVSCVDKEGKVIKKADWQIAPETKRQELVSLAVDVNLLRPCWEEGGTKLIIDAFGSKCKVPFPRVVKCAGEFTNCKGVCKTDVACNDKCEANRRICLSGCK